MQTWISRVTECVGRKRGGGRKELGRGTGERGK